jgi:hypothetical protein
VLKSTKRNADPGTWLEWCPGRDKWKGKTGTLADLRGTRHQSAFAFVIEHRDSMAVVCSQDGNITMLAWPSREKSPLVVRNVEQAVA